MAVFSYEQLRNMNPGEFRVYNFIVSHLDAVPDMNIRQIAAGAKVSTTTVLRFCEKSGCSGYTELKYRIRQELNGQVPAGRFDAAPAVQYMETSAKDSVFTDKMARAAKLCADAGQIILSGDRESKPLIRYGAYLFSCAGKAAFPAEDGWGIVCPKGETRHALLILSPWGSGQDLIALVNTYKKAGAPLVTITNPEHCPAAQMSDVNFSCYMPEIFGISRRGPSELVSQIPVVYLLETLTTEIQKFQEQ